MLGEAGHYGVQQQIDVDDDHQGRRNKRRRNKRRLNKRRLNKRRLNKRRLNKRRLLDAGAGLTCPTGLGR